MYPEINVYGKTEEENRKKWGMGGVTNSVILYDMFWWVSVLITLTRENS